MWSNRYTLLHPERVQAAAIGHAGSWLAVPVAEHNGVHLNWPLGLANYPALVGEPYQKYEILKSVPMLVFIGDKDSNTYSSRYPTRNDIAVWGDTGPTRLENQYNFLKNLGFNVSFKLYPGVEHQYTREMTNDVFDFLTKYK